MPQAGIHAALGYHIGRIIPYQQGFLPAVILGAIFPDLDVIMVAIGSLVYSIPESEHIFHRSFSHSFFTLLILYLGFAALAEWKKKPVFKTIGKGLLLGILTHIVLDTFFWFSKIHFLWPLPLEPFNLWTNWQPPERFFQLMLILEFLCFRWYAWFLIQQHIKNPQINSGCIKYLEVWKKSQTWIFILFIILFIVNPPIFPVIFGIFYLPSLMISLWSTFQSWDAIDIKPV